MEKNVRARSYSPRLTLVRRGLGGSSGEISPLWTRSGGGGTLVREGFMTFYFARDV